MVNGFNGVTERTKPMTVRVFRGNEKFALDAREEPRGPFPDGIQILLSAQHCRQLGIDINHAIQSLEHRRVKFLRSQGSALQCNKRARQLAVKWHQEADRRTCRLTERLMAEYLAANDCDDGEVRHTVSLKDVVLDESLMAEEKQQAEALLEKYSDVFMESPDDCPPILKGVERHSAHRRGGNTNKGASSTKGKQHRRRGHMHAP